MSTEGFSWSGTLTDVFSLLGNVLLKSVLFLIVLLIGWFVARLIRRAIAALLARMGVDRAVERAGLSNTLSTPTQRPSSLIATIVYYSLMIVVLMGAFSVFGPNNPISQLLRDLLAYLPNVFVALAIVVVTGLVARKVVELVHATLAGRVSNASLLARGVGIAIMVIGGFAALSQLHIAPAIINGLFFALLAIIVGAAVISIGGGGIVPMRRQWERAIDRIENAPISPAIGNDSARRDVYDAQAPLHRMEH